MSDVKLGRQVWLLISVDSVEEQVVFLPQNEAFQRGELNLSTPASFTHIFLLVLDGTSSRKNIRRALLGKTSDNSPPSFSCSKPLG